jgi:DNA mismatch endonuclease (patch repair protein)
VSAVKKALGNGSLVAIFHCISPRAFGRGARGRRSNPAASAFYGSQNERLYRRVQSLLWLLAQNAIMRVRKALVIQREIASRRQRHALSDVFNRAKRSQIMSRVRRRGNKNTELEMINLFRKHRITGWRRRARVFGNPDFVFPKLRLAMFVDGCFWHSCPKHATKPASNAPFWRAKLNRNRSRDRLVTQRLRRSGWKVIRVWQHSLTKSNQLSCARRIKRSLRRD